MARSHGRILASIWDDDDFRDLSPEEQRMYMFLLSQPNLNHAGLLPLTLRRWARTAAGLTGADIEEHLTALARARFVVLDEDTEEVLVRSFVRNDGVWKQPRVMGAMVAGALEISSRRLRAALLAEVDRIPLEELSDALGARGGASIRAQAFGGSLLPPEGGASRPDSQGSAKPSGGGSAPPSPTPSPTPSGTPSAPPSEGLGEGDESPSGMPDTSLGAGYLPDSSLTESDGDGKGQVPGGSPTPSPGPAEGGPQASTRVGARFSPSPTPTPRREGADVVDMATAAATQRRRPDGLTLIPDDFHLTTAMRTRSQMLFGDRLDPVHETKKFIAFWRGEGRRKRNWYDAWEKWMLDSDEHRSERENRHRRRAGGESPEERGVF
jgi:hypothetical protein